MPISLFIANYSATRKHRFITQIHRSSHRDSQGFAELCGSMRVRHPQHGIVGRDGKTVTAQIRKIDEALWLDAILFHPPECIGIVPSLLKGGFIVGAAYGKGVVICHTDKGWSAPAFFRVEGGSFGLQIGGQAVDLIMLVMNEKGMDNLLSSKFKIGADASAAAGPVGRHAEAATDWKMRAELLTYSRARGLLAGISLNGAVVKQDQDDSRDFYGHIVPFRTVLAGQIAPPAGSEPLLKAAAKYAGTTAAKSTATEVKPATHLRLTHWPTPNPQERRAPSAASRDIAPRS